MTDWQLDHARCEDWLPAQADASADLILVDPPYFRVKDEPWDRQWETAAGFLAWLDGLAVEWRRILKPNGSLYVFASPQMAARVEITLQERFNILNHIIWKKHDAWGNGMHSRQDKEKLRAFFPQTERIIFAELPGADSYALGVSSYERECDKARGLVFEPIRAYLAGEFARASVKTERANEFCGTRSMAARHYFTRSQWCLPTDAHYASLRAGLNREGRRPAPPFAEFHPSQSYWARYHPNRADYEYLRADYEYLRADYEYLRADYEYLRADYEELRADYEELRRPFSASSDAPFTDVWDTFPTVAAYPGKHVCEKPLPLLRHIITSSTRPGALVLDCFAGSGNTGIAARQLGRRFVGCEASATWHTRGGRRIADAALQGALLFGV